MDSDKASFIDSRLFKHIALALLLHQDPKITSVYVNTMSSICPTGKVLGELERIKMLFGDAVEMRILGNKDLNRPLTQLASILSSEVSKGNLAVVSKNIRHNLNDILNTVNII
ncbi:hypothetical protein DM01DRAFT_1011148 [Hesseltinella vesiculosa]|uniref:Uncharacterized protein n=1 Tax=Hesseltinella vesiculosa TaxID=101127 RepID=A0A1X2GY93_9FUNG|nr:hypothetical protein DM01DRAFT_1011148 [Hesseltinella vesiculosa]